MQLAPAPFSHASGPRAADVCVGWACGGWSAACACRWPAQRCPRPAGIVQPFFQHPTRPPLKNLPARTARSGRWFACAARLGWASRRCGALPPCFTLWPSFKWNASPPSTSGRLMAAHGGPSQPTSSCPPRPGGGRRAMCAWWAWRRAAGARKWEDDRRSRASRPPCFSRPAPPAVTRTSPYPVAPFVGLQRRNADGAAHYGSWPARVKRDCGCVGPFFTFFTPPLLDSQGDPQAR